MAQETIPAVRFATVGRYFAEVRAIDRISFEIANGEFFSLLGPSGSGKTTCLRLIAGFEQPDMGAIEIHGTNVAGRSSSRTQTDPAARRTRRWRFRS